MVLHGVSGNTITYSFVISQFYYIGNEYVMQMNTLIIIKYRWVSKIEFNFLNEFETSGGDLKLYFGGCVCVWTLVEGLIGCVVLYIKCLYVNDSEGKDSLSLNKMSKTLEDLHFVWVLGLTHQLWNMKVDSSVAGISNCTLLGKLV